jgi:hypothetical protein
MIGVQQSLKETELKQKCYKIFFRKINNTFRLRGKKPKDNLISSYNAWLEL